MARVTVEESQKEFGKPRGFRMFKFEPGGLYHVLFLGEKVGDKQHPVIYMNHTHNVKKDGKGFEVRCASEHFNIDDVVARNEDGSLLLDARTGKPVNDGTCPYCETQELHNRYVFAQRDAWMKKNPNATKLEIKEQTRKLFQTAPISEPAKKRVAIVAVFELDSKGKPVTDENGNKIFSIQAMKMSDNQFNKKLMEQVEIKLLSVEDENDGGIAWHEYYFKYPKTEKDNKMLSAKDMSITPVANELINSDTSLRERLETELENLDLDSLEDLMYIFKLKTLEEMERDIAPLASIIPTEGTMSDKEIQEALEELGEEDLVTDEEANDIMGEPAGAASFDVGVSEEEISNLM